MAKINYITDRNIFNDFDNHIINCMIYTEDTDFKRDRILVKNGFAKNLYQRYPEMHEKISEWFDDYEFSPKSIINNAILGNIIETTYHTLLEAPFAKHIFALFVQEHKGEPTNLDNVFSRARRLETALFKLNKSANLSQFKIGIPLIGSGNAADPDIKRIYNSDKVEYFKQIIVPVITNALKDLTINVYC